MAKTDKIVKWGIVSTGLISHDFVNAIHAFKQQDLNQVIAVAARNLKSAEEFAQKFDIPKAYEGYEKLAQDPEVQVVYVGSINTTHLEVVKLLLENGKNILCEKPLGMNVKEVQEMLDLAKSKNLFLMEAIWSRFQPAYLKLKELIEQKEIGQVFHVQAEFGMSIQADSDHRVNKKALGGGVCLDIGIYCVQLAQFVFQERPTKVSSAGHLNADGVDETVCASFMYSGNRSASFQFTSRVKSTSEAHIYGTEGKITLKFPFWCTDTLQLKDGSLMEFPLPSGKHEFNFLNSAGLAYEAMHVRECLVQGLKESPKLPHQETLLIAELLETIRKEVGVSYQQD